MQWILHSGADLTAAYHYDGDPATAADPLYSFKRDFDTNTGIQSLTQGFFVTRYVDGELGEVFPSLDAVISVIAGPGLAIGVPAQNPIIRTDVNNDSRTSAVDALRVINAFWRGSFFPAADLHVSSQQSVRSSTFRVTANVSVLDALQIINQMARDALGGAGESEAVSGAAHAVQAGPVSLLATTGNSVATSVQPVDHEEWIRIDAADAAHETVMAFKPDDGPIELPNLASRIDGDGTDRFTTGVDELLASSEFFEELTVKLR